MDYKLERKIHLNEDTKYDSLYKWCLNELDENNKKIGRDFIPWQWSLYFMASSLRVVREIEIKKNYDKEKSENKLNQKTQIVGNMHSGCCIDGKNLERDVSYSMFGTNRKIKDFQISILPNPSDEDKEICNVWGSPSYDFEVDYQNKTAPDIICFELFLNKNRFNEFASLVESKKIDSTIFRVTGISGFYSDWSPSISTSDIKVLTGSHVIETSKETKVKPLKLGSVNEFNISFTTINKMNLKISIQSDAVDKIFDDSEIIEDDDIAKLNKEIPYINYNNHNKADNILQVVRSLKMPLWFIFGVLVLLLFK